MTAVEDLLTAEVGAARITDRQIRNYLPFTFPLQLLKRQRNLQIMDKASFENIYNIFFIVFIYIPALLTAITISEKFRKAFVRLPMYASGPAFILGALIIYPPFYLLKAILLHLFW